MSASYARADFQAGFEAYSRGDYKTAMNEWLVYAANDDPRALFNLGQMYRLGVGTGKDVDKAEYYYRRAAELGHVGAQANLGSLLLDRTPPQGSEAVIFLRQAAIGGDAKAQFMIGVQYFNGDYLTRDYVLAYAWLSLAAKAGLKEAGAAREAAKTYMDPPAIEKATRLASTLVLPPAPQSSEPPAMQALLPADLETQLDAAVLRHPIDDLSDRALSPISPDAVAGAIPIPEMDDAPAPQPRPAALPARPKSPAPIEPPETREAEYRIQLSSFPTKAEAEALRHSVLESHAKLLAGVEMDVEQMLSAGPQAIAYRVRSTPLKGGEAAATSICARLQSSGVPCQSMKTVKIPVSMEAAKEAAKTSEPSEPPPATPSPQPPEAPAPAATETADEPGPHPAHPGDNWRVQVGAGKTEEEARFRWSRLMGSQAALLDAAEL